MPLRQIQSFQEAQHICQTTQDRVIVFDFSATWCGPCQRIYPVLNQLSQQYPQMLFFTVDIDEVNEMAQHFEIQSVPSFKFIYNNKIVAEFSGADEQRLRQIVQDLDQEYNF